MDKEHNPFPIGRVDYEAILRQAVAVIEHARLAIAKHVNTNVASAYWEIGTLYYAQETLSKGWNRDLLLNAIKMNMYEAQAISKVDNNFSRTLPMEQAKYLRRLVRRRKIKEKKVMKIE